MLQRSKKSARGNRLRAWTLPARGLAPERRNRIREGRLSTIRDCRRRQRSRSDSTGWAGGNRAAGRGRSGPEGRPPRRLRGRSGPSPASRCWRRTTPKGDAARRFLFHPFRIGRVVRRELGWPVYMERRLLGPDLRQPVQNEQRGQFAQAFLELFVPAFLEAIENGHRTTQFARELADVLAPVGILRTYADLVRPRMSQNTRGSRFQRATRTGASGGVPNASERVSAADASTARREARCAPIPVLDDQAELRRSRKGSRHHSSPATFDDAASGSPGPRPSSRSKRRKSSKSRHVQPSASMFACRSSENQGENSASSCRHP